MDPIPLQPGNAEDEEEEETSSDSEVDLTDEQIDERMVQAWDPTLITLTERDR